jgi:sirohydrochlorin cobaltochelatase
MTVDPTAQQDLEAFEARIRLILPEQYQDAYNDVQPVSMGSASLKFGPDGRVAWDEIWGSFCDLAMAGGPPHKGALLEPGTKEEIAAQTSRYQEVVEEVCRGIGMVSELFAEASAMPGWILVECTSSVMAAWLVRAILMENVSAACESMTLYLPAGPHYRLEKEIKNVITVIAKTCHYWFGHTTLTQRRAIASLFAEMESHSPLIQPAIRDITSIASQYQTLSASLAKRIHEATGLQCPNDKYRDWLGLECHTVPTAIWLMRALVVSNVLSRREGTLVFVPMNPASDPQGERVLESVITTHSLGRARNIFPPQL